MRGPCGDRNILSLNWIDASILVAQQFHKMLPLGDTGEGHNARPLPVISYNTV